MWIFRDLEGGNDRLTEDYFCDTLTYEDDMFKRCFQMSRGLFNKIVTELEQIFSHFQQKIDATGTRGFTSLQKCTSTIRQLAYDTTGDSFDEYFEDVGQSFTRCFMLLL
jgi:hypothetical protein